MSSYSKRQFEEAVKFIKKDKIKFDWIQRSRIDLIYSYQESRRSSLYQIYFTTRDCAIFNFILQKIDSVLHLGLIHIFQDGFYQKFKSMNEIERMIFLAPVYRVIDIYNDDEFKDREKE